MVKPDRAFPAIIFTVLSYEWLTSGIDKLLSGRFLTGLHEEMLRNLPYAPFPFYARFLKLFGLPHCEAIAALVETGEIAVGLAFIALAVASLRGRQTPAILRLGFVTNALAAFIVLNFFFYQGGGYFIDPNDPFDEGISVDCVIFLMQVGIMVYYWLLLRDTAANRSRSTAE